MNFSYTGVNHISSTRSRVTNQNEVNGSNMVVFWLPTDQKCRQRIHSDCHYSVQMVVIWCGCRKQQQRRLLGLFLNFLLYSKVQIPHTAKTCCKKQRPKNCFKRIPFISAIFLSIFLNIFKNNQVFIYTGKISTNSCFDPGYVVTGDWRKK